MDDRPRVEELEHLRASPTPVTRDELQGGGRATPVEPDRLPRLAALLRAKAEEQLAHPPDGAVRTESLPAREFILDLEANPQAYVIGCVGHRSSRAEQAWGLPYQLKLRLGDLGVPFLARIEEARMAEALARPPALHRFPAIMAKNIRGAMDRIVQAFDGDASRIWSDEPSAATVVRRFLEFDGVGAKIATMAATILVVGFRVPLRDHHFLDLSVDARIRRVFERLGLTTATSPDEAIIYWARELVPSFPGSVDVALREVGRILCRPQDPECAACFLAQACAYALSGTRQSHPELNRGSAPPPQEDSAMPVGPVVAGVDGCKAGWFVVKQRLGTEKVEHHVVSDFAQVLELCREVSVLAIDIPIGLLDIVEDTGRPVDRLARGILSPHRASSVFPAPCRPALAHHTYEEAAAATRALSAKGRSLTRQSFGLFPKLREVDGLMTPERQAVVREVHPELCFATMNGDRPMVESKTNQEGQRQRISLLREAGFVSIEETVSSLSGKGVRIDDILDAHACCWTAARIVRAEADRIPEEPTTDSRGLRMEMWF
ncbi:MAG: DUF429 domain-containing protein [Thermoleophilia bacterium]|nr:DUF429 domain-containing protein [Thermoleophilia bacterium]